MITEKKFVGTNAFYRWYLVFGLYPILCFLANITNAPGLGTYRGFTDVIGDKNWFFPEDPPYYKSEYTSPEN